jgi:cold shock CspA family protein
MSDTPPPPSNSPDTDASGSPTAPTWTAVAIAPFVPPTATGNSLTGTVRIYDRGRLTVVGKPVEWDRESDVVVPVKLITAAGITPRRYGTMTVRYVRRAEGRLATEIISYDASTERPDYPDGIADDSRLTHAGGTVKWFNGTRGYGFLATPAGDCLLHASILDRCGLYGVIRTGDRFHVGMVRTSRGWYAVTVEVADGA